MRIPRRATSRFRPLPEFLILGGQRCGTTSLFRYLEHHPSIASAYRKEVGYFCSNSDRGESWYRAHFPTERVRAASLRATGTPLVVGEATPYYLLHPAAAARAAALVPDAKLIVLLRNPVERAFSGYGLQRAIGTEDLSFADAIDREDARLAGEEERLLADPGYRSLSHRHHSYRARGRYAEQLERWFAVFPRDRFLILSSEQFFADPAAAVRQVVEFLGLPDRPLPAFRVPPSSATRSPIESGIREQLAAEFAEPNRRLYELLGVDYGWN